MPKVLSESRRVCPELTEAVKALDIISYTRQYSEVFSDFIDWLVYEHMMPPSNENPLKKYSNREQALFVEALKNIQSEVKNRVNMWTASSPNEYLSTEWYDPLGRIYECITSKHKSSAMGQFFTPKPVVDMMVQMTDIGKEDKFERILDPTCGSGRMGLAAATQSMVKKNPSWITMNDLDPICSKMTAVNMCLNGIVGESVCMNGLDIEGDSFRFAYQVQPMLASVPQEMWEFYRMLLLSKTGQDIKKQYVIRPIRYEETFLKQSNDGILIEIEQRRKIANEQEKQEALQEIKDKVSARLSGTLFEGDHTLINDVKLTEKDEEIKKTKATVRKEYDEQQGKLFT